MNCHGLTIFSKFDHVLEGEITCDTHQLIIIFIFN